MADYKNMSAAQIKTAYEEEQKRYIQLKSKGVNVDMTRGRPSKDQLEIAMPMLKAAGDFWQRLFCCFFIRERNIKK